MSMFIFAVVVLSLNYMCYRYLINTRKKEKIVESSFAPFSTYKSTITTLNPAPTYKKRSVYLGFNNSNRRNNRKKHYKIFL